MIQPAQSPAPQDIELPEEFKAMALIDGDRRNMRAGVDTSQEERSPFVPAIRN
ncbi:MAG: hypothetical protein ACAH80_17255 [Alphaproteobacteria bacterium]